MFYNTPEETFQALCDAHYKKRNIPEVISLVTDDVEWIGTEANEYVHGKAGLEKQLRTEYLIATDYLDVTFGDPRVQYISHEVAIVSAIGKIREKAGDAGSIVIRLTVCCKKTEQGWLIAGGHTSVPNAEFEKLSLQSALDAGREQQKALLDNIPGGVAMYRVKKDGHIEVDYVSDGLARICGYDDSEDIMRAMREDVIKMICPEDLHIVKDALKASLKSEAPESIHFRAVTKTGTLVSVTLDSVFMKNAKLGPDDVAVIYAVHTLMSEKASKKAKEDETLLSLLNTVPAGIGVFQVTDDKITENYLNNEFYHLIGSTREERKEYYGDKALSSAHPKDIPRLREAIKKLEAGDRFTQLDYRIMGGKGEWIWLHLVAAVVDRQSDGFTMHVAYYECGESKKQQIRLLQNQRAVILAEKRGKLSIWTYKIDKGVIEQHIAADSKGHMGYPTEIEDVPNCFVKSGCVYPDDIEKFLDCYKKLQAGEEKVDSLYRLRDQDSGEFNWVHMYYQRVENDEDDERIAVGFSLIVNAQQEAIEHYQTEQKLREQMYADAMIYLEYNLSDNVYEGKNNLDEKYRHGQWVNPDKAQYRENMSANVEAPYLDEVVDKMYSENLRKAFDIGETKVSCEYRSKERPGKPSIWCRMTAIMVKRPDTDDITAFVYVENIEHIIDKQLAIEGSLSSGLEIVAMIRVLDGDALLVQKHNSYIPDELGEHFIYDEAFVNKAHRVVVHGEEVTDDDAAYLPRILKELENKEVYQYSITTERDGRNRKRQLMRFRYLDDRKTYVVMSISDVTAVYLEEQDKKKQLFEALSEAQLANQAKAEFYARMSHDMRTPMNGILGMAELSKDELDSEKLRQNIKKIHESGEYLLSLINDTLDIQRIESGKLKLEPAIIRTTDMVNNILDMVSVTAKAKDVRLRFNKGNTDLDCYVRVDPLRMKQIFVNLLSNAIKFTPSGGTVEFEFKLLEREGMISHDVVYVRDTGVGMSEEFMKDGIFKPFSQESNAVSAVYAGSGLGLSIAKSLIEMMGGHIEVESEIGVGTTFAVYIDFERVENEQARAALQNEKKQSSAPKQLQGSRILLAEDHPLNAEIAKRLLQNVGCEVTWVENGQEAVKCFKDSPVNSFDAVLMDIRMPIMDGLEATRQIRAIDKADATSVPIIAMTANAYTEDVRASLDAGMNAHLGKPVNPRTLYETLASYVKK